MIFWCSLGAITQAERLIKDQRIFRRLTAGQEGITVELSGSERSRRVRSSDLLDGLIDWVVI